MPLSCTLSASWPIRGDDNFYKLGKIINNSSLCYAVLLKAKFVKKKEELSIKCYKVYKITFKHCETLAHYVRKLSKH